MKSKLLENKFIKRSFWIIILLCIWELIALSGKFSPLIFPPLAKIFHSLYLSIISGEIVTETLYSFDLIFKGLIIGLVLAVILSSLSVTSKVFEGLVDTLIALAHPLPGIALLPLIILWIGTGSNSVVFIIVHSVVWPMVVNLLAGFKSIPKIYKQIAQNYELNTIQTIIHIMLPASLPYFISGLKIGWARAWRALISAEMLFGAAGGKGGLGWFIFKKRVFMDTAGIFSGLIIIILIGILVEDFIFSKLENITLKKWGISI